MYPERASLLSLLSRCLRTAFACGCCCHCHANMARPTASRGQKELQCQDVSSCITGSTARNMSQPQHLLSLRPLSVHAQSNQLISSSCMSDRPAPISDHPHLARAQLDPRFAVEHKNHQMIQADTIPGQERFDLKGAVAECLDLGRWFVLQSKETCLEQSVCHSLQPFLGRSLDVCCMCIFILLSMVYVYIYIWLYIIHVCGQCKTLKACPAKPRPKHSAG